MACRLIIAWTNAEFFANWTLENEFRWKLNTNTNLFIHENAYKDLVCQMAAIMSMGDELK